MAYINADGGSIDYLTSYGDTVTDINDPVGLTLSSLAGFNAVVVASNEMFSQPGIIGNVLAAFAANGGGVVLTEATFQGSWALGGGIMNPGFSPFTVDSVSSGYYSSASLGTVFDPANALLEGAGAAQTQFQGNVGVNPGSTLVADWTSGRPAVGFTPLAKSSVVGLNLFPDAYWSPDIPTETLVANAIQFSLRGYSTVPEGGTGVVGLAALTVVCGLGFSRRNPLAVKKSPGARLGSKWPGALFHPRDLGEPWKRWELG